MRESFNVSIKIAQIEVHTFGNVGYHSILWKGNCALHSVNIFLFFGKGIGFSILVISGPNGIV